MYKSLTRESIREYQALKIFEGSDFHASQLPNGYYMPRLKERVSDEEIVKILADFSDRGLINITDQHQQVELLRAGKELFDKTYYEEQAYDMVDEALKKIEHNNDGIDTDHPRYPRISDMVNQLLDDNNLVEFLHYERSVSQVKLLAEGYKVLDVGGIRNYLLGKEGERENEIVATTDPRISQKLFNKGKYFDAFMALREIILTAKKSITLIDNFVDEKTLVFFVDKPTGMSIKIITTLLSAGKAPFKMGVDAFNRQSGGLAIATSNSFHDRFLILDDTEFFMIGASIKDAGNKLFMFVKLEGHDYPDLIRSKIETSCLAFIP